MVLISSASSNAVCSSKGDKIKHKQQTVLFVTVTLVYLNNTTLITYSHIAYEMQKL